jgi:hypothetical protein
MACHDSFIDLAGYRRLPEVERAIWYSPVTIGLALVALVGAVYAFGALGRGFIVEPMHFMVGYAILLGGYGATFAYCQGYRFRHVKCPGCDEVMQPYIADLDSSPNYQLLGSVEIGGRYYRRPYDEDDRRPWVRLMVRVRACGQCQTFVSCSRLHRETCTEEELGKIGQRVPSSA